MDKKTFVDRMAEAVPAVTKKVVHEMFDAFCDTLVLGLRDDGEVMLNGIGKFSVEERPARVGRNPATGESINIPAKKKVKFKAGKALKGTIE